WSRRVLGNRERRSRVRRDQGHQTENLCVHIATCRAGNGDWSEPPAGSWTIGGGIFQIPPVSSSSTQVRRAACRNAPRSRPASNRTRRAAQAAAAPTPSAACTAAAVHNITSQVPLPSNSQNPELSTLPLAEAS